ncbi:Transposase IS116/IS110/IS902 family protein [Ensifer sp. YR511]|nr:Transposase IS116/IS110/IS902 family protein [Ensifer sp. YR511]
MRLGWFRPVHCKSLAAQEVRALLTARKLIQGKLHDIEMSIRGILRGFGLKVGPTTRCTYAGRIRELIAGHSTLEAIASSLLKVRDALVQEFAGFERTLRAIARQDDNALRLMTTPGVGVLVALTFVAAIDAPERFRSSRAVGPHFGLTPRKYQSGETDHSGRISKIGDGSVRTALYEAAHLHRASGSAHPGGLIGGDDKTGFRTGTTISPPEQGPFAGTVDRLGRYAISSTR